MKTKKVLELSLVEAFLARQMKNGNSAEARANEFFYEFFSIPFMEFERLEREALHVEEVARRLREIKGDIAKAKVERRNEVKSDFSPGDVLFNLEGNPEKWPVQITQENHWGLFRDEDTPHYIRYFDRDSFQEVAGAYRKIGILRKVVRELLKNKKLKLELEREYTGGGWGGHFYPVLKISW